LPAFKCRACYLGGEARDQPDIERKIGQQVERGLQRRLLAAAEQKVVDIVGSCCSAAAFSSPRARLLQ
jgi:hypothetical protein